MLQTVAITLIVLYAGAMLFALFFARGMIFPAPPANYSDNDPGVFKLPLPEGGTFSARYFPNPQATHALLYSHGNGEDIGSNPELWPWLRDMGFSVLAYDYPGYGTSGGRASEQACYDAIESAYNWLIEEQGLTPEQIVLFGRSVGGGPTIDLAARKPVGGVILDGTFTSAFRVMTQKRILPWDCFNSIAKIDKIYCPLLVLHGTADRTVPFWHGQALYEKAAEPKSHLWVEGAGHNNLIESAGSRYSDAIVNFRQSLSHE
ncbi:alpha/beta hydrolase [Ruficoccus amylovorans]|uniref:Alpha/beta hydrolase n=1 Tax=Ruficoccus amylovorans TaxID=1804625 RepID=A0A842HG87_9BACT|nr:alpha/beta hydrolase [Ruficoccus amylovorans]MBC2595299.1 alpha/beta hydrolase [Ruficoccus amylovorans]